MLDSYQEYIHNQLVDYFYENILPKYDDKSVFECICIEYFTLRFLRATNFKLSDAKTRLEESIEYRYKYRNVSLISNKSHEHIINTYNSFSKPFIYFDEKIKRVVMIHEFGKFASSYDSSKLTFDEFDYALCKSIESIEKLIYSSFENSKNPFPNLIIFADLSSLNSRAILNFKVIKHFSSILGLHFPELLIEIHMYNTPFIFKSIWKMLNPLLDSDTKKKINIHTSLSSSFLDKLDIRRNSQTEFFFQSFK